MAKILQDQNRCCALCLEPFKKTGKYWYVVDHCHETGRVRGLLHMNCNTALGLLGDTPGAMRRVLEYVES